ncbi:membrane protein [Polaribacter pacificus]|uniref:Membrane protein n=1 Tax=Polaribacter pacificus TaxID=1775173 RepID=A0A917I2A5_9FLAO|nr:phosphoethanolamine transferase [Polaribacter pacificus]GGH02527.1 membrane protein [Polaribacter pacificus]
MNFKKILIYILSAAVLLVPDLIIASKLTFVAFILTFTYKVFLLLAIGSLFLYFTKSYFKSYLIVGGFYLFSSFSEIIISILFKEYSTLDHIKALFFIRTNEIEEFTKTFYIYAFIPILIAVLYFVLLWLSKKMTYQKRGRTLIVSALLFISSIFISGILLSQTPFSFSGKNLTKYTFKTYFLKQHPFSFYYRTYEFVLTRKRYNQYSKKKEDFKFNVSNNALDSIRPETVVFVIGERARAQNWTINGYNKETSPNLNKFTNLITFKNNHSNAATTAGSIPLILTQATPKTHELVYSQKTIVTLFKEANYKTYWISNQFIFDYIEHDKEPDVFINLFKNKNHTDLDVIPVFDSIIQLKTNRKKLIVVNLAGGHGKVPEEFHKFKAFDSPQEKLVNKDNRTLLVNEYDNMIFLQDFVLGKLISSTAKQKKSSFLIYTADHGTNLFDDNHTNIFGYGSSNPTEKETNVPLFIWSSDQFINQYREKYSSLQRHQNFLTTNDNLFYTLADMAEIKYEGYKSNLSISSSSYIEPTLRLLYLNGSYKTYTRDTE